MSSRPVRDVDEVVRLIRSGPLLYHTLSESRRRLLVSARGPLSASALTELESQFGSTVPGDLKQLLLLVVPSTVDTDPLQGLPGWGRSDGDGFASWFNRPAAVALDMVRHLGAWSRVWGHRPADIDEAIAVAQRHLVSAVRPWPVSREVFGIGVGVAGPTMAVWNGKLTQGPRSALNALEFHLGARPGYTRIPMAQPWRDLVAAHHRVYWWPWNRADKIALSSARELAEQVTGGVTSFGQREPSLVVNVLLRSWVSFIWDLERNVPMHPIEYYDHLQVRRQLDTIQRALTGPTATRLNTILQPMDHRFDPTRSPAKNSWWLDRDIAEFGWTPSHIWPGRDEESMNAYRRGTSRDPLATQADARV
jgi:hypothetical protein